MSNTAIQRVSQEPAEVLARKIASREISLDEVWAALQKIEADAVATKTAAAPPDPGKISEAHIKALENIQKTYGVVAPDTNRALTQQELRDILTERADIDLLLGLLKKRKDEGIREALANHLDHVLKDTLSPEELAHVPIDKAGHYQRGQEEVVSEVGLKVQKIISDPKPTLSAEAVQKAYEDGVIDRKTYLQITRVPDVPRVLDEGGLAKAVKADPALLFTLADYTTRPTPTTTIKVAKSS